MGWDEEKKWHYVYVQMYMLANFTQYILLSPLYTRFVSSYDIVRISESKLLLFVCYPIIRSKEKTRVFDKTWSS